MSTQIRRLQGGVIIIQPHGKLVGHKVSDLRAAVLPEAKAYDIPRILINLEHVNGMSSSALGVLIQAYKIVKQKKGRIGAVHVGKHIKNLLIVSRITSLFEHFDNEAEAISELSV